MHGADNEAKKISTTAVPEFGGAMVVEKSASRRFARRNSLHFGGIRNARFLLTGNGKTALELRGVRTKTPVQNLRCKMIPSPYWEIAVYIGELLLLILVARLNIRRFTCIGSRLLYNEKRN